MTELHKFPTFQSHGEVARWRRPKEGGNNEVLSPVKLHHHEGTWFFPRWWMRPVSIAWWWRLGVKLGTSSSKISRQRVNFRDTLVDSHLARASFVVSKDKDR